MDQTSKDLTRVKIILGDEWSPQHPGSMWHAGRKQKGTRTMQELPKLQPPSHVGVPSAHLQAADPEGHLQADSCFLLAPLDAPSWNAALLPPL